MMKKLQNLFYCAILLGTAGSNSAWAQLDFSEDFEANTLTWTDEYAVFLLTPELFNTCTGQSLQTELYSGYVGFPLSMISPSLGISNGGQATLEYSYKVTKTNNYIPMPNDPDWGTIAVEYATAVEGPWTVIEVVSPNNHIESATCATRTATFFPPADTTIHLRYTVLVNDSATSEIDGYVLFDDIKVTQVPPCTAAAPAGILTPQAAYEGETIGDLNTAGFFAIQWYADAVGGQPLPLSTPLSAGVYYAAQITEGENSCEGSERIAVTVTINTVEIPLIDTPQVYEGTEPLLLYSIQSAGEGTTTWYATEEDAQNGENALPEDTEITADGTYYATRTIDGYESDPVAVDIQVLLGTGNFSKTAVSFHPNPVKDILYLTSSQNINSVKVYNLLGQEVAAYTVNGQNVQVYIANLKAGIYTVKVNGVETSSTVKIVKSK